MPAIGAIVAVLGSIGSAVAGAVGMTVAATGIAAAVIGGAVVGAVIGGVVAAVKGENILKGALKGGLIGGALGGLGAWAAPAAAEAGVAAESISGAATAGWEAGLGAAEVAATAAPLTSETIAATAAGPTADLAAAEVATTVVPNVVKSPIIKGGLTTSEKMMMIGSMAQGGGDIISREGEAEDAAKYAQDRQDALIKAEQDRITPKWQEGVTMPQRQIKIESVGAPKTEGLLPPEPEQVDPVGPVSIQNQNILRTVPQTVAPLAQTT